MAIMYPSRLSDRTLGNRKLKGEIGTYDALSKLSDEFEIFYNRCVNAAHGSKAYKRRIDFIVLHEKLGLLAIEVKGGKIRIGQDGGIEQYHPSKKQWVSIDPYGQVERATIELIKTCKADGANHWIPDDTCVIFPDTMRRDITDTPHILPEGTLCCDDLPAIATQISTLFSKSGRKSAWSREAFLDMRRRLQNMPEAKRGNAESGDKPLAKKAFYKSLPKIKSEKTQPGFNSQNENFEEEYYEDAYVEGSVAKTLSANYRAYSHGDPHAAPASSQPENTNLQWWQGASAILLGALGALAYAWFHDSSLLRGAF